ncbi:MAG TPA: oxidoreductase [Cytophagales bacterium]|nr:oxidoreductase [Cytophagales bacterium]HAA22047.1 oxidoreductase [Cytophagales bacterium]HAP58582.1 oxidoreductase [Cytophagales bacterium]
MTDLTGKNYWVAGGSTGIGLAVVKQLRKLGGTVTVLSRSKASELDALGVQHYAWDATTDELPKEWLPEALHGVVYAPGTINLKPFQALKPELFRQDWEVNVLGAVKILQASMRAMKKAQGASVVLYSTVAVGTGMNYHASVAAAKGAVEGLGRSLAAEWAKSQIRVNVVAPSLTDTPLAAHLLSTDEKREASEKRNPLGIVGSADQVADATLFLLQETSRWITGQVLAVDGGMGSLRPL